MTDDGDILYVFPGFAGGDKARKGRTSKAKTMEAFEADERTSEASETRFTATPEVLQFEVRYLQLSFCRNIDKMNLSGINVWILNEFVHLLFCVAY